MSIAEQEIEFRDEYAPKIYDALYDLLRALHVEGGVSYRVVEEVVIHLWRDLERLWAIHHERVHSTKACSYLAFWIRKLKPISNAYPVSALLRGSGGAPRMNAEVTDINEQVALHLALTLMRTCIIEHRSIRIKGVRTMQVLRAFDKVVEDYLTSEIEDGLLAGRRFENMVYDMRFRTYGPHHLTHFLVHITRDVFKACKK